MAAERNIGVGGRSSSPASDSKGEAAGVDVSENPGLFWGGELLGYYIVQHLSPEQSGFRSAGCQEDSDHRLPGQHAVHPVCDVLRSSAHQGAGARPGPRGGEEREAESRLTLHPKTPRSRPPADQCCRTPPAQEL
ncbi:uncharacterized protein LOC143783373 [Ranitomeya variabilis]|uniref:uncharacterized protein LOC143783373 n=1 Tax=Ranitomeya variabilis TaxID=490064 RepID=UPI004056E018